ncbi:penicillin-binding protein 2 [Vulcanimicrobium alpinum]|uniref:Penicillin-binding protein 2 n=1 Tax=Vulcanimicrobium alpinum TaxID=3016050 RepID=A0AAN1XZJ1_UNVUL|nr:penicillin-binding protein 2 [Vulcanimicrobium alpinum]BDE08221.1 penicillin-binding protein 2 [Vulcanimicrobium alpinum]
MSAAGAPVERPLPRIAGFLGVLLIALIAIVARLAQVQLVQGGEFAAAARANQIEVIPIAAPRGLIVDRHGTVMVRSRPSFVCALIPSEITDIDKTLAMLADVLRVPAATLQHRLLHHHNINYKNFDEVRTYEPYGPVILASDLTAVQMARLAEAQSDLPGVDMEEQPVRNYPYGKEGAHIFGYVGVIDEDEYAKRKRLGYSPNDVVGKDGLENAYDRWLHGRAGGEQVEVNASGALVRRLKPLDSIPGDTLVTTIDWKLQRSVEKHLGKMLAKWGKARGQRLSGAVVVLDPYNGSVLALASMPAFDPNAFATPIDTKRYNALLGDKLNPLYDRAIGAASPSGSTFKMVTGSAAISSGVIAPHQVLYDSGAWSCYGTTFVDIAAGGIGSTGFEHALAASSDGYFYQLGWRLKNERLRYYATQYGLGSKLGIDLPGEYPGNWPTEEWVQATFGKGYHLEPSDACQLAIGQGSMQATPLQIASVAATVINGGTLYRPHLVSEIRSPRGTVLKRFDHEVIRHVNVSQEALREVREGMAQVTKPWGTASGLEIPGLTFSGKTGTAETEGGNGPNTTWFVAWAPSSHPKFAMAVYMEKSGGYGASVAAPVAQHVIADYFGKKIEPL